MLWVTFKMSRKLNILSCLRKQHALIRWLGRVVYIFFFGTLNLNVTSDSFYLATRIRDAMPFSVQGLLADSWSITLRNCGPGMQLSSLPVHTKIKQKKGMSPAKATTPSSEDTQSSALRRLIGITLMVAFSSAIYFLPRR